MPSFLTHQILAEEIYSSLPKSEKSKINNLASFYLGAQGADPMFLYRPINTRKQNIGKLLHRKNVYDFFSSTKKYFSENTDGDALSYIIGYISHYAVDCVLHQYIYSLEKEIIKTLPRLRKRDKIHFLIEKDIDTFIFEEYKKQEIKDYTYPITFGENSFESAFKVLDYSVWETYGIKLKYSPLKNCFKNFIRNSKLLFNKSGILRGFIYGVEKIFFMPHYVSYLFMRSNPDMRFTNYRKENCLSENCPSIYELFKQSISYSIKLIKEYLNNDILDKELFSSDMNKGKD